MESFDWHTAVIRIAVGVFLTFLAVIFIDYIFGVDMTVTYHLYLFLFGITYSHIIEGAKNIIAPKKGQYGRR